MGVKGLLVRGAAMALGLLSFAAGGQGPLTSRERVAAQEAIERVFYEHRIWPKENPGPKPTFEEMVPAAVIEEKALAPLQMTALLKEHWEVELSAADLQAEMERMERDSKDRATLHELFAALGNDPLLIAETLVRAALADRVLRHRFAWDGEIHAEVRANAEAAADRSRGEADWSCLDGAYSRYRLEAEDEGQAGPSHAVGRAGIERLRLPAIEVEETRRRLSAMPRGSLREEEEGWILERKLPEGSSALDVEVLFFAKQPFGEWYGRALAELTAIPVETPPGDQPYRLPLLALSPAAICDAWEAKLGPQTPPPAARREHTAVWTGSEMIVWGGYDDTTYFNTGGRYTPATDSWQATSTGTNVPSGRMEHTAVWTGTEMIVWGGRATASFNTGGRYNPASDTWSVPSTSGAPNARFDHTAVWTGTEMIVWGGDNGNYTNTGGRYTPSTNAWSMTSTGTNVAEARFGHTAVWTGTEMIVWGGSGNAFQGYLNTGGRYTPSSNSWTTMSVGANLPTARKRHTAVWTGTDMVVWGGYDVTSEQNTGGRYRPSTNSWTATSTGAGVPSARYFHTAVWTGSEMIVWGGRLSNTEVFNTGGRYNPTSDAWTTTITGANLPAARTYQTAVWTGTEMIVWGGTASNDLNTGGRYNPTSNAWSATSLGANGPTKRQYHSAVWTGSEMIVWGGKGLSASPTNTGGRYIPATDTWTATSTGTNVPTGRQNHTALWTGSAMLVWGGRDAASYLNTGGRYNPVADSWLATSTGANVPGAGLQGYSAVWTGSAMIIWGGMQGGSPLSSGSRYNPAADTWLTTSEGAGVPDGRYQHTAVWTGSEMIVWGGSFSDIDYWDNGGRYSPVTDTWAAGLYGGIDGRRQHTAVWTGTEMILWGGYSWGNYVNTGGRYNPTTGIWTGTSIGANVPSGRVSHTALWTGTEMVIWGGHFEVCVGPCARTYLSTGGRYSTTSDTWTATSTGANLPAERTNHSGVWTGGAMILWGGYHPTDQYLNTGGINAFGLPATPANSLTGTKTTTVNLSWTASAGATTYNVKRCSGIPCTPAVVVATPATNSYSEVMDSTSYFYTVEAVNACGVTP